MRDKTQGKRPPRYAKRCLVALRKALKSPIEATGKFWESILVEQVKKLIIEAIPARRSWDPIERSKQLETHAKWIVKTVGKPITVDGKDGAKIEL